MIPPCVGKPAAFDRLIDSEANTAGNRAAARATADICGTCEIRQQCLGTDNKREHWAIATRRELQRRQQVVTRLLEERQSA